MYRRTLAVALVTALSVVVASAETTRSIRGELGDTAAPFEVENLAGVMIVRPGEGDSVVAVATIHAQDAALAEAVTFERVRGSDGATKLLLRYPVREHRTYRYPNGSSSQLEYDGRRVKVSSDRGVLLWAEVEITVPRRSLEASFFNHVGMLTADGLEGRLRLDSASGDITARNLTGQIVLDTGSGEVRAETVRGDLACDTGSGDCDITGFEGDALSLDTGSGHIRATGVSARRVSADTGSGDVSITDADIESFNGDTGSGDILLEVAGGRLRAVRADTGSGDVRLRLPAEASFTLHADQGSGDLVNRFPDARAIVKGRTVVGYERGDGAIRIEADTGSGDVVIGPAR